MGIKQSRVKVEDKIINVELHRMEEEEMRLQMEPAFSSPARRERYLQQCVPLHRAALQGDLPSVEKLLNEDPSLIEAHLTQGQETALHIAAAEGHAFLVKWLLPRMRINRSDVGILNKTGCTALAFAAAQGHLEIAEMMVRENPELPTVRGPGGVTPLFMAALNGCGDMAIYLFSLPQTLEDFEHWAEEDQRNLLNVSIESGLYGLAIRIVSINERLVSSTNGNTPLAILARNPSAFCDNTQRGSRVLETIASKVRLLSELIRRDDITSATPSDSDAYALFHCLWEKVINQQQDMEIGEYDQNIINLVFIAAESGNYNFLVELIHKDPAFLYRVNHLRYSMFHIAILIRNVDIFNLIYEVAGIKYLIATYIDPQGNNMLHLAAMIAPRRQLNDIPGAALQMQRQVLWYKEVEKIVEPSCRNMRNENGLTPHELFLEQHEGLMKEGEKQMKQTAKACMLVTMLITTVAFTSAFTLPGGYDGHTGAPILEKNKLFVIFPLSEALATLFSLTSTLMFLSILIARYAVDDFLTTLPFWLVSGVMALFVSIVAMVVTFCTSLLFYERGVCGITVVLMALFASVLYMSLKYQLLVGIVRCTCGCRWLFGSRNRLFAANLS